MAPEYSELDVLYTTSMIGISDHFRSRLVEGYRQDEWYAQLFKQIDDNESLSEDAILLPFIRGRPLLFEPRLGNMASGVHAIKPPESPSSPASNKSIPDRDLLYHIDWITGH